MTPEENKNMKDCTTCKYGFVDEQFGFPMCHHPLRFSEDCVDFNMHEEVEESEKATGIEEKKLPEGLDEAAEKYADKHGFRVPYDGSNNYYDDVDVKASKEGFLAGAEWMAKQGVTLQEQPATECNDLDEAAETHVKNKYGLTRLLGAEMKEAADDFKAGAQWQKKQMLEDAVEGEVHRFGGRGFVKEENYSALMTYLDKFKDGDRVKIIIVMED